MWKRGGIFTELAERGNERGLVDIPWVREEVVPPSKTLSELKVSFASATLSNEGQLLITISLHRDFFLSSIRSKRIPRPPNHRLRRNSVVPLSPFSQNSHPLPTRLHPTHTKINRPRNGSLPDRPFERLLESGEYDEEI